MCVALSFFGECSSCTDRQILSCSKLCTTVADVYKSCQTEPLKLKLDLLRLVFHRCGRQGECVYHSKYVQIHSFGKNGLLLSELFAFLLYYDVFYTYLFITLTPFTFVFAPY